jgi:hypothetical protein
LGEQAALEGVARRRPGDPRPGCPASGRDS